MTKFKIVDPKHLIVNKKYLTMEILEKPKYGYSHTSRETNHFFKNGNYLDALCGTIKKIHFDNSRDKNIIEVSFNKLTSLLTGEKSFRTYLYINNTLFFEFLSNKENIQKNMEQRNLRDIMRHLIGDDKFTHYLFDDSLNKNDKLRDQIEIITLNEINEETENKEDNSDPWDISETNILYTEIEEYLE